MCACELFMDISISLSATMTPSRDNRAPSESTDTRRRVLTFGDPRNGRIFGIPIRGIVSAFTFSFILDPFL